MPWAISARCLLVLAAMTYSLSIGTGTSAAQVADVCAVPPPGIFAGAPPEFRTPPGGTKTVSSDQPSKEEACTLRRSDGTLFARSHAAKGLIHKVEYFDAKGVIFFEADMDADRSDEGEDEGEFEDSYYCETNTRNPLIREWHPNDMPIHWRLNEGSIPGYLDEDVTLQNLRNAHIEWESHQDKCGIADSSWIDWQYDGITSASVGQNGLNSIGFGVTEQVGGGATTLGIELTWFAAKPGQPGPWIVESDIRFDSDNHSWANGAVANKYDVWHIAAHELGHQINFGHVDDIRQVMAQGTSPQRTWRRKLSRGDAEGVNAKY